MIHGGFLGQQPTTVIDLTESTPEVVREGRATRRLPLM